MCVWNPGTAIGKDWEDVVYLAVLNMVLESQGAKFEVRGNTNVCAGLLL